jgi:hypothetical protein
MKSVLRMYNIIVSFQTLESIYGFDVDRLKAPILKEVDTSLHTVYFNGSFMKENAFRLNAGPEVDAAWESLGIDCKLSHKFPVSPSRVPED